MKKNSLSLLLLSLLFSTVLAGTPDVPPFFGRPLPPRSHMPAPKVNLQQRDQINLTNLVIFVCFADDEEITRPLSDINNMFSNVTPGSMSVYNYFDAMSYGKIHYNTVYTNQVQNNTIVSYRDPHPRSYFEPYSDANPNGYPPFPAESVCPREMQMLAEIFHYIDSLHLVDTNINLDGNEDGYIDNVSFIVKGGCGEWASLLWPHMEFFNQTGLDFANTITVNGKIPYTYNFELEGSGYYFSANVFCHEMCHSLGLPDFYHYYNYTNISPVWQWDIMGQNCMQQLSSILKYKFLGIVDEPIEITQDGTYTLNSNASADHHNCYYIKSAIDPNQWFTFEYRNNNDYMDNVYESGMIIGRWVDTMDVNDIYASGNAMFDFYNVAHSYWVFRPLANIDTLNGIPYDAAFSTQSGRNAFGPTTDPHPYLTDGTPERSFEITNIQENGSTLSFDVRFLNVGIETTDNKEIRIYPNPVSNQLMIEGEGIQRVEIRALSGALLFSESGDIHAINTTNLASGLYLVSITTDRGVSVQKMVKE